MAEYTPADLPSPIPRQRGPVAVRVPLPAAGTLAHVAARYAEGAGAFGRLAAASGVLDPIPWPGLPPRAWRRVSLQVGADVALPAEGLP